VDGKISISPRGKEIEVASNKTIIGIGDTAEIDQGGFRIIRSSNVIIRNLTIGNTYKDDDPDGKDQDWDGIQMDTADHIWIDHCDFHHGGDGLIDSRKDTTYLTVSWTILRDHNKTFGIGWTDNVTAEMTIHHNWIRNTHQRNPATDNVLRAHLYNNFMQNITSYGNHARGGTHMVLQNSVFDNVKNPYYYDTGSLVAMDIVCRDCSGKRESTGSSFAAFDPADYYDYELDPVDRVESLLEQCAGPLAAVGEAP
jgi:pectate lyase